MPDKPLLREKDQEAICNGRLRAGRPDRATWKGTGSGAACALCGETVSPDKMWMEIEFTQRGLDRYFLHPRCFSAWELERTKIDGASI
jgi:hypothetical protein